MTLDGQVIGQAERATRALLELHLRGSGLAFERWVAVNQVHAAGGGRAALVARLVRGLKIDDEAAEGAVEGVVAAGLVADDGEQLALTDSGRRAYTLVSSEIAGLTARLYADLPPADLEIAGRVLALITERANAELAAAAS